MTRVILDVFVIVVLVQATLLWWLYPKCSDGEFATLAPSAQWGWVCVIGVERK